MSLDSPLHFPSFPSYFCSCVIFWVSISSEITLVWNPHHLNQLPSPVSLFLQVSAGSLACNLLVLKWKHKVSNRVTISIKGYCMWGGWWLKPVINHICYMACPPQASQYSATKSCRIVLTQIYIITTQLLVEKVKFQEKSLANSLFNVQGINVKLMWICWTL